MMSPGAPQHLEFKIKDSSEGCKKKMKKEKIQE